MLEKDPGLLLLYLDFWALDAKRDFFVLNPFVVVIALFMDDSKDLKDLIDESLLDFI